jgi:hypothetical protein
MSSPSCVILLARILRLVLLTAEVAGIMVNEAGSLRRPAGSKKDLDKVGWRLGRAVGQPGPDSRAKEARPDSRRLRLGYLIGVFPAGFLQRSGFGGSERTPVRVVTPRRQRERAIGAFMAIPSADQTRSEPMEGHAAGTGPAGVAPAVRAPKRWGEPQARRAVGAAERASWRVGTVAIGGRPALIFGVISRLLAGSLS